MTERVWMASGGCDRQGEERRASLVLVGAGVDIIEVERVRMAAERTPSFLTRVFTPAELAYAAEAPVHRWRRLAARFAAKEALLKALGTGLRRARWQEVEVIRGSLGRPELRLSGSLAERAARRGVRELHLSIAHSRHYAVAQVLALGRSP